MEPWETTLEPAVVPSRLRGRMEERARICMEEEKGKIHLI